MSDPGRVGPTLVLAGLAALGAAAWAAGAGFRPLALSSLEIEALGALFFGLLFAALVIERAVEVFVANRFEAQESALTRTLRLKTRELALDAEALEFEAARNLGPSPDPAAQADKRAAVEGLRASIDRLRREVRTEKAEILDDRLALGRRKATSAATTALFLGVIVAAAGLRVLEPLAADPTGNGGLGPDQIMALRFVDVVLTALLLAGGADGIHRVLTQVMAKRDELLPKP